MKQKCIVVLCLCLMLPSAGQASEADLFDKAWQYGGSSHDHLWDALPLMDGGLLLAGYTESTDGDLSRVNVDAQHGWRPWALRIDREEEIMWQLVPYAGMWGSISFAIPGPGDTFKLLLHDDKGMRVLVVDAQTGEIRGDTPVVVDGRSAQGSGFDVTGIAPLTEDSPVTRMTLENCFTLGDDMLFWCVLWGERPNRETISRVWLVRTSDGQDGRAAVLPELDNTYAMSTIPWADGYLLAGAKTTYRNGEILRVPVLCALHADMSLQWLTVPEVSGSGVLYSAAVLPDGSAVAVGFCGDAQETDTQGYAVCISRDGKILWQRAYSQNTGEPILGSVLQVGDRCLALGGAVHGRLGLWEMDMQGNLIQLASIGTGLEGPEDIVGDNIMRAGNQLHIVGNYSNAATSDSNIMVLPLNNGE